MLITYNIQKMEGQGVMGPKVIIKPKLPPGFRFDPTEQELLLYYLKPKVFSLPLPASIIPEINLKKYDPWDLPGIANEERYFFNIPEAKYRRNKLYRLTSSGYWKVIRKDRPITTNSQCNQSIGIKRVLMFYIGRPSCGSRTNWIMHEYHLLESNTLGINQNLNTKNDYNLKAENWAVCRIFEKNKCKRRNMETIRSSPSDQVLNQESWLAFLSDYASSSSCITCSDDEVEQNSTCTSNPLNKNFN